MLPLGRSLCFTAALCATPASRDGGGVINAECGTREQPAGCLRPAGLLESASLSLGPGRVRWSQCSQLMRSKEVQEGHNEKWAVVQRAKKRLCYSTPSPGCAVAPSAAVAVSVLGTGSPFPLAPSCPDAPWARGCSVCRTCPKRSWQARELQPGLEGKGIPSRLCWKAPARRGAELLSPGRCCPALNRYPWDGRIPMCPQDGRSPAVRKDVLGR